MCAQSNTAQDSPAALTPPVTPVMPWRVRAVRALPGYRLHVEFRDGLQGTVDMGALVKSSSAGVFAQLADEQRFRAVYLEYGAVTWPGEIDLAPDAMYAEIRKSGEWVLV
jgi:hypothetical protein